MRRVIDSVAAAVIVLVVRCVMHALLVLQPGVGRGELVDVLQGEGGFDSAGLQTLDLVPVYHTYGLVSILVLSRTQPERFGS